MRKTTLQIRSIDEKIFLIRRHKVMLDSHLATLYGVAMLSSILNSDRAIQVNIHIMRAFVKIREWLTTHRDLHEKIKKLERKFDKKFTVVFSAIQLLLDVPAKPQKRIGFGK